MNRATWVYIIGGSVATLLLMLTIALLAPAASGPSHLKILEVPERHKDLTVLLADLQKGEVSADYVTQILLIREIENEGVFLLWKDVDTFGDRVLVHKATHEAELEYKKLRYKQIQQKGLR